MALFMKKNLLIGILVIGVSVLLCGFDSSESAESVLEQSGEAALESSDISVDLDLNCDIAFEIGDGTITSEIDLLLGADLAIDLILDPLAVRIDGSYQISALGSDSLGRIALYAVPVEGEDMTVYIYTGEEEDDFSGNWYYSTDTAQEAADLFSAETSDSGTGLSDLGFVLAPEAAEYHDTECYLLSTSLGTSMLEELTGEDGDAAFVISLLDGICLKIDYYIDTETYLPAGFHLDLNDSDLTSLNSFLQSLLSQFDSEDAETSAALLLNDVSLDLTFSYGTVDSITVPQEALDAVASGQAELLDDYAEEIGVAFEEENGSSL